MSAGSNLPPGGINRPTNGSTWDDLNSIHYFRGLHEHQGAKEFLNNIYRDRYANLSYEEPSANVVAIMKTEKCPFVRDVAGQVFEQDSK
jgi:hypothetical protein